MVSLGVRAEVRFAFRAHIHRLVPASDVNWLPTLGCLGHPVAFSSTSFVVKRRKRPAR
jgi:hypothetical protein